MQNTRDPCLLLEQQFLLRNFFAHECSALCIAASLFPAASTGVRATWAAVGEEAVVTVSLFSENTLSSGIKSFLPSAAEGLHFILPSRLIKSQNKKLSQLPCI